MGGVTLGGVFIWGAVVAAGTAFFINTVLEMGVYFFTGSEKASEMATDSVIAPVVEEILKGFAVLTVYLVFRREFDSILDGIVYAGVAALGFAATENVYYIYSYGYQAGGYPELLWLVFVRVVLVGWQDPFYTAFTGIDLAITRLSRNRLVQLAAPPAGLLAAILTHSFHNTVANLATGLEGMAAGTLSDWTGWFFMFLIILWATNREQRQIVEELKEEVTRGLITPFQYQTASSAWSQSSARLGALLSGHYTLTSHFYQTCTELAHKKHQWATLGEEGGNSAIIERLRGELARLPAQLPR